MPDYSGTVVVPTLWDTKEQTIISTESADILKIFSKEFNQFCATQQQADLDLFPIEYEEKIKEAIEWLSPNITSGVYKVLRAKTQQDYDKTVEEFFGHLQRAEDILSKQRYIAGDMFTGADVMLFCTLIRFDAVYHGMFRLYKKRIVDYENLWGYVREIYQMQGVSDTVDFHHIRMGYMANGMGEVNKDCIIWAMPEMDLHSAHGRDTKFEN